MYGFGELGDKIAHIMSTQNEASWSELATCGFKISEKVPISNGLQSNFTSAFFWFLQYRIGFFVERIRSLRPQWSFVHIEHHKKWKFKHENRKNTINIEEVNKKNTKLESSTILSSNIWITKGLIQCVWRQNELTLSPLE